MADKLLLLPWKQGILGWAW